MNSFLQFFLLLPFFGFVISLLMPSDKEVYISRTAFVTVLLQLIAIIVFTFFLDF